MFDPNQFDKQSKQIQAELEAISSKAVNSIADAFSKLPKKLAETFQTGEMEKMLRVSVDIGKSFENLKKQQKEIAGQQNMVKDFIKMHEAEIAVLDKKREGINKDKAMYKETSDLIGKQKDALADISKQLRANTNDRKALLSVYYAEKEALAGLEKRQAEINRQIKEQTVSNSKLASGIRDLVILAVNQAAKAFMAMRAAGFDAVQSVGQGGAILGAQWSGLMNGVLGSTAEYAAAFGGLANQLGTLDVPKGVVQESVRLTTQFGLSTDAANHLNAQITRMNDYSGTAAANVNKMAYGFAVANKMAPGQIFKDMAENSEIFATYAGRGAGEFIKGAIAVREMGTSLKSMSGFADRIVNDFEGSLKMQAEVQTILPGMDFSQIMYASQFGTEKDVAEATKHALQATGVQSLDQLPRSVRNKLQTSLGLSKEELQNLMSTGAPEGVKGPADVNMAGRSVANVLGDSLGKLLGSNTALVTALGVNTAALFMTSGRGGGGGMFSGLAGGAKGLLGKIGGLFGKTGAAAGAEQLELGLGEKLAVSGGKMAAEGAGSEIPILGGLLGGGIAFGASLMAGEGFGKAAFRGVGAGIGAEGAGLVGLGAVGGIGGDLAGGALYDSMFGNKTQTAADTSNAPSSTEVAVVHSNQQITHLLGQILSATREHQVVNVYLNGKKVNEAMTAGSSRGGDGQVNT